VLRRVEEQPVDGMPRLVRGLGDAVQLEQAGKRVAAALGGSTGAGDGHGRRP